MHRSAHAFLPPLVLVAACAVEGELPQTPDEALPVDQAPPPSFDLAMTDVNLGGKVKVRVDGGPTGTNVAWLRSETGRGTFCAPQLGGECLNLAAPVVLMDLISTNSVGDGFLEINVPSIPAIDGGEACFQVASAGSPGRVSNRVCADIGFDDDDDRVINAKDVCPGEDDFYDWDRDGTPDGCDPATQLPPTVPTGDPLVPFDSGRFQGEDYIGQLPDDPAVGFVFLFHGTGGSADAVESPDLTVVVNELLRNDIGFVMFSNQSGGTYDDSAGPGSNPDWSNVDAWRDQLIASGDLQPNTPIHFWGFSAGANMASYAAHAAQDQGWNTGGLVCYAGVCRSSRYGDAPDIPTLFIGLEFDTTVPSSQVEGKYDDHIRSGFPGSFLEIGDERLAPERFNRSPFIRAFQSRKIWKAMVEQGYIDKGGFRLFSMADIDDVLDAIGLDPEMQPSAPVRSTLTSAWATHSFNGNSAEPIRDWYLTHP